MSRRVSFVVLFYRDAPTVEPVIAALDEVLSHDCSDYEIIAIDDHSPDETGATIEKVAGQFPRVLPLRNESNLGVGGSFRRAVEQAQYDWIGYTDGDDQYEMRDLGAFWSRLDDHDVVSGYRANRADGWQRHVISRHFNWITNRLFGLRLKDTNSGLKIYRAGLLKSLSTWDSCAFCDTEILVRLAHEHHARITEVPIGHRPRSHGRAAGLSTANVTSVIEGMIAPAMAPYRTDSRATTILLTYCRCLLGLHRLTRRRSP